LASALKWLYLASTLKRLYLAIKVSWAMWLQKKLINGNLLLYWTSPFDLLITNNYHSRRNNNCSVAENRSSRIKQE
jgi:hypothetical protein